MSSGIFCSLQGLWKSQIDLVVVVFHVQIWDGNLSYISLKMDEINPKNLSDPHLYSFCVISSKNYHQFWNFYSPELH